MDNNALDKFGKLIITNYVDATLDKFQNLIEGKLNAPSLRELQDGLKKLDSDDQRNGK